jgi:hypothetical protein
MLLRTLNDSGMLYILWYLSTYAETFIPKTRFHGDLEEVSSGIPPFPGKGEVSYPYCKAIITCDDVCDKRARNQ